MTRVILTIIILIFFCFQNFAQNDCSDNLNRARQNFEEGFIEDIPNLLEPCLDEGFSREQKISAYKLLILTYLFDDNQTDAESAMIRFFKEFPNYELRTDDPTEFVYLFESYEAVPMYSFFGAIGPNISIIRVRDGDHFSVSPTPDTKNFKFSKTGFTAMFGASYNLDEYLENLSANARLEFSRYNYEFEEDIRNTSNSVFAEKQFRINIPLYASYNLADIVPEFKFAPEVYLGGNFEFVTSAKAISSKKDDLGNTNTIELKTIKSKRRSFEPSLLIGANYSYPIIKGSVFFDIHTKIGITDQSKNRFSNSDQYLSVTNYIDDDFKLHNIYFSIGYRYTFYKPTKIR